MNLQNFFTSLFSYLSIFPAAVLCLAPVQNHLRFKKTHTFSATAGLIIFFSIIGSFMENYFSLDFNTFYLPVVVLLFFAYHNLLTLHVSQTLSVFMLVVVFFSFLVNFSIIFDALQHPDRHLTDFSLQAAIFQFVICMLFSVMTCRLMAKYGAFLLEHLQQVRIWMISVLISAIFFLFNLRMVIHHYSTLHTNLVGIAYITIMPMMFILFSLLCIIFYFIVNALVNKAKIEDRNHILEMQEKQYETLQSYIDADEKARHDFRQTLYALKELSTQKNYAAIDDYLKHYIDTLPQKETTDFCRKPALNALLNHYDHKAKKHDISTDIRIFLPKNLYIDVTDLCSIAGNILENAIIACLDIPENKRFIHLIMTLEQGDELYIALSNSYRGKLRKKKDRYLSTHKGGSGIGLISVTATAECYSGNANFSHDDNVFYSNIMLVNKPNDRLA